MLNKIKDFRFVKFCRSKYMDIKRQRLLKIVTKYFRDFYPISALNTPLLIFGHYNEEVVKSVADLLGYEYTIYPENSKHFTIIIFDKKDI